VALSAKAAGHNPISSLLFAIWLSFRTVGGGRIFSRMLVQGLNSMDDKPWGTMANGKGITVGWLATQLERHGIKPRTIRIGTMQAKGCLEDDFEEAFQRYMSPSDTEAMKRVQGLLPATDSGATGAGGEQKTEGGGQKTEDEEQKTEGGGNEAGDTPSSSQGGPGEKKIGEAGEADGGEAAAA